jgi:hypothetical protein
MGEGLIHAHRSASSANVAAMKQDGVALDQLVEEVAMLLEATVRVEEGIFHLTVPISDGGGEEDEDAEDGGEEEAGDAEEDEPALQVTVALSTNQDGTAIFATRRLCAFDESVDVETLLREVSFTIHVQLSIDEDNDVVLGGAAPVAAGPEWIADMVGEVAEFALDIAEDAAHLEVTQ